MIRRPIIYLIFCFSLTSCLDLNQVQPKTRTVKKNSILLLRIEGLITSELSERFMLNVRRHANKDKIKGVLIRVNSPGGTVGASQEINATVLEIKKRYKKPVYVSGGDLVASGAVYSIVSADKIFVNPGTLFGSIGILMQFSNISELIRWAKMEIYNLKAGEFKDSGSPLREMTLRERELFEDLMEGTMEQFKTAILEGRKIEDSKLEQFADGRVFSGVDALEYGLVDSVGTFNQTIREIGEKTGLGSDPDLFDPDAKTSFERFFETLSYKKVPFLSNVFSKINQFDKLSGHTLFILPSYIKSY
ncbi:MAG: signal peptide peptidase SppA [Bdellovibrionaceae bacterium]|nr:signal peptide peptidase SppA [Pseudobdellovibrionaceae bacterium]